ncbi:MAG: diaminopimelate epimerase [Oscillospiraceae bacterium]|nr:diaminopimelate epimerase [Oscillospiraceae bacterium]
MLRFTKMHGCGNDYIYFNCFEEQIDNPEELSILLSDRHFSIGGDGVILVCPSEVADAKMRMFNADGSEGKMCGNGIRCVAKLCSDEGIVGGDTVRIETLSGIKTIELVKENGVAVAAKVDMGAAIFEPKLIPVTLDGESVIDRPLDIDGREYRINCVSMGNPHCVIFTQGIDDMELEKIGRRFECHGIFPERVNTEFVEVISDKELKMRVWERGSGETWACGTGTCATVAAAVKNGICKAGEDILVHLRGGDLVINYTDERVLMTGEAVEAFRGTVKVKM